MPGCACLSSAVNALLIRQAYRAIEENPANHFRSIFRREIAAKKESSVSVFREKALDKRQDMRYII